jgi:hypothetical protein
MRGNQGLLEAAGGAFGFDDAGGGDRSRPRRGMNHVYAELPDDQVGAARLLDGTEFVGGTALEGGRTRLEGYASDAAVPQLEALGATVTILKTSAEEDENFQQLLAMIDEPEPPIA